MEPFLKLQPLIILLYQFKPQQLTLECLRLSDILVELLKFEQQYCQQIIQQFRFRIHNFLQRILQVKQPRRHRLAFQRRLDMTDEHIHQIFHDQNEE